MKKLPLIGFLAFVFLLFMASHSLANEDVRVIINEEPVNFEQQLFFHEDHVYVPLRELSEELNIQVDYNHETRTITLNHPNLHLELGLYDERLIIRNDYSYVPIRFINEQLGAQVRWDGQTRTVYIESNQQFAYNTIDQNSVWVAYQNGEVFLTEGIEAPQSVGSTNHELFDIVTISGAKMGEESLALKIYDLYGAPHINHRVYTMVINDGEIVQQEDVYFMHRYEGQDLLLYEDLAILNSGHLLKLVNSQGDVVQEIQLAINNEQNYDLIKLEANYMLIRGNDDGYLLFVNRETGERVALYKELIENPKEIEYIEDEDKQVPGDQLKFIEEENGKLIFSYDGIYESGTYSYELPKF